MRILALLVLVAAGAAAESPKEAAAAMSRVERWQGKYECTTDATYKGGGGFSATTDKKEVQWDETLRERVGGTFFLTRNKHRDQDSPGTAHWSLESENLTGSIDERELQTMSNEKGTVILEDLRVGSKKVVEPPYSMEPQTYFNEETGQNDTYYPDPPPPYLKVKLASGEVSFDCPRIEVEAQRVFAMTQPIRGREEKKKDPTKRRLVACNDISLTLPAPLSGRWTQDVEIGSPFKSRTVKDARVCTWALTPAGETLEQEPVVEGPRCGCSSDEQALATVELTARPAAGSDGKGRFEAFEVTTPKGEKPKVLSNTGGATPKLILGGDGRKTGLTRVVAVYRNGGAVLRSAPYEVSFCALERPVYKPNAWVIAAEKFLFDEKSPGRVEVNVSAEAWVNGADASGDVRWELLPTASGVYRFEPMKGPARLVADAMPEKNEDFGRKQIVARFEEHGCQARRARPVSFFFPTEATNNPGSTSLRNLPNWAYYWAQTTAGARVKFSYTTVDAKPPLVACPIPESREGAALAYYDICRDEIFLTNLTVEGPCARRQYSDEGSEGIDCFAELVRHESHHQLQLIEWWGPKGVRYSTAADLDLDLVPDAVEHGPIGEARGCRSPGQRTCKSLPPHLGVTDLEFEAYEVGWRWPRRSADDQDWSCPGRQCPM